ncbi:MAG: hypothetical protein J0H64_01745 [Actinobacteria bacterium]|nr:hypothetical protein [Actinomycetota bacterium]
MRIGLTLLGLVAIAVYAVAGALLMNDWAIVAASHLPLSESLEAMSAADQPHSFFAGIIFAVMGGACATAWAVLTLLPRVGLPAWASLALWAAILVLGAPAYFIFSFGNMMSVGDTFYDWDSDAAFALERPLYLISLVALAVCAAALLAPVLRHVVRRKPASAT